MRRLPVAREGWIFIIPFALLAIASLLLQRYFTAILLGGIAAFVLHFFRDPLRAGQHRHVDILSPADGSVVQIRESEDPPWPGLTRQICIYLSIFDVHVNRAPITGKVVRLEYGRGGASIASDKSSTGNEQNLIVMEGERITVAFRQIAGLLARRIVCDVKEGDTVARGERVGMIKFGSRVDVYLPSSAKVLVAQGDKLKVGLTVIAEVETR